MIQLTIVIDRVVEGRGTSCIGERWRGIKLNLHGWRKMGVCWDVWWVGRKGGFVTGRLLGIKDVNGCEGVNRGRRTMCVNGRVGICVTRDIRKWRYSGGRGWGTWTEGCMIQSHHWFLHPLRLPPTLTKLPLWTKFSSLVLLPHQFQFIFLNYYAFKNTSSNLSLSQWR